MPIAINGSGTVTGISVGGLPDGVITPAELSGGVASNGPAFSVRQSGTKQSIPNTTWTKVRLDTELFDTANCFDSTTNYRFTPNVAGYYQFSGCVAWDPLTSSTIIVSIWKNGVETARGARFQSGGASQHANPVSALIYMNGTTDYVELHCYQGSGGAATLEQGVNAEINYFTGSLVRADLGGIIPTANTIGAGGKILLGTYTASGAASLPLTGWYQSQFDEYEIEFLDLLPSTDNVTLRLQLSTNNGSTYDTGTNYKTVQMYAYSAGTTSSGATPTDTGISFGAAHSTTANYTCSGSIKLFNPGGTSLYKNFIGYNNYYASSTFNVPLLMHCSGFWINTAAYNACRFIMSSGNISGSARIYGLTK